MSPPLFYQGSGLGVYRPEKPGLCRDNTLTRAYNGPQYAGA
jgi:hypothetical protein